MNFTGRKLENDFRVRDVQKTRKLKNTETRKFDELHELENTKIQKKLYKFLNIKKNRTTSRMQKIFNRI